MLRRAESKNGSRRWAITLSLCVWTLVLLLAPQSRSAALAAGPQSSAHPRGSGLPLPRFASLKSDRVNIRKGPGREYSILWVYQQAGLPVEVVREYQGWREIRDAEGSSGWVFGALLSGRRTALVLPWDLTAPPPSAADQPDDAGNAAVTVKLHETDQLSSTALALLEAGVLANLHNCNGSWCDVTTGDLRGFIEQKKLWGIYPNERLK